jgi:hypothetical protein
MQTFEDGVRSMGLILSLNWDRLCCIGSIALALGASAAVIQVLG